MPRIPGQVAISVSYEVQAQRPFDARMLVDTKADLYDLYNWSPFFYQGMIVSVANDTTADNNGVYILKDSTVTNNTFKDDAWVKLFDETSFDTVVANLEEDLQNYVDTQLNQYSKMSIGELPEIGDSQTIYFRELDDNWEEYIWHNDQFVMIGSNAGDFSNYYTKTEIDGLLSNKQDVLVSGTNIKTINGQSILGEGNIEISGGSGGAISPATESTIGGILATDNSTVDGVEAFVDVDETGKASVKIPSVDETSTADDVVNLLNTTSLILNGNAE